MYRRQDVFEGSLLFDKTEQPFVLQQCSKRCSFLRTANHQHVTRALLSQLKLHQLTFLDQMRSFRKQRIEGTSLVVGYEGTACIALQAQLG
jgi:hypothetical protein